MIPKGPPQRQLHLVCVLDSRSNPTRRQLTQLRPILESQPLLQNLINQNPAPRIRSPSLTIADPSGTTACNSKVTRLACGERFVEKTDKIPVPQAIPRRLTDDIMRKIRDLCDFDTWEDLEHSECDDTQTTPYPMTIGYKMSRTELISQLTNSYDDEDRMGRLGGVVYHNCKKWGWQADIFEEP